MKGSAPNLENTGSQTPVQRKLQPNARRAGAERTNSSTAIAPVIARTESANAVDVSRKAVSAMRQRGAGRRDEVRGTAVSRVTGRAGCGGDAVEARLHEAAAPVPHRANGKLVLDGVDELDVADRVRRLLDQTGYAFVPLATDADGPVDGRPLAHGRGPLGADLREVVCEDVGGAAPVRAVDR